ncbi:MAG: hypothetical protein L0154_21875 [Chloroflexi bacterium]|nr:hypothetical protein [Chloroflexota bacterium]
MNDFTLTDSIYAVPTRIVNDCRDAIYGVRQPVKAPYQSKIHHLPEIYFSLAEAYARKDNHEAAWANIERGLQLASKADELHQMAHAYQSMTRIAIAEGRPDVEIEAYFEKSAELWRKMGALPDPGRLLIAAGEFMTEQKKLDRAAKFFEEASEVFDGANLGDEAADARARLA